MNYPLTLPHFNSLSAGDSTVRAAKAAVASHEALEHRGDTCQAPALVGELLRIHEYERQRLGQELHDSTGQLVVSLQLSLARLRRIEQDCGQASIIDEIQDTVRRIDKEIRSLAFLHYPAELGGRSLALSLERLALDFGRRSGLSISFSCQGETPSVDESASIALLRVTQEALVNVLRHSHANAAKVQLKKLANQLELRIADDGIGMREGRDAAKSDGIGLQGMRYRIETLGGRFEVRNLNPGLLVRALVPVSA